MPAFSTPNPLDLNSIPFFYGVHNDVYEVTLHEPNGPGPQVPEALV